MAFTQTLEMNKPVGSDDPKDLDDIIREETKEAFRERLDVDHDFTEATNKCDNDTVVGKHRKVTFVDGITSPTVTANETYLFTKVAAGVDELHFLDNASNEIQITSGGKIYFSSILTLPLDTADTTEANLRYNTTDDVVEYRNASAWKELAIYAGLSKIKVGYYTGNAAATQAVTGVGFQADVVLILPEGARSPHLKTSTMGTTYAKSLAGTPYNPDAIRSLDADGFTVGDGTGGGDYDNMNASGEVYHYIALKVLS